MAKAAEIAKTDKEWYRHFEFKTDKCSDWHDMSCDFLFYEHVEYRLKPRFIDINGHQVPEPVREPLKIGQVYWLVRIHGAIDSFEWEGDHACNAWLERGLIHLTEEAAEAHRVALLSFTQK
ncbi:hypothetical protein M0J18_RS04770 [Morganella morganii]|nr:hypothetical protein [Morganella morganii]